MTLVWSCLLVGAGFWPTATRAASLYDAYVGLQFRNPPDHNVATKNDTLTTVPQCVLYSELDNVSTVNQGWDINGAGWELEYPYLSTGDVPPTGLRSAVPLGGMGTGNFELRGDGTFRQWCIESQSPGGGAKHDLPALDQAFLGLRVRRSGSTQIATTLRTHPPEGLPGVDAIKYEGAVPVSKLTPLSPGLENLEVYAHGVMAPWDTEASMIPAVAFTLTVANPSTESMTASLLLALPLAAQPETGRAGPASRVYPGATSGQACKTACDADVKCAGWTFTSANAVCGFFDVDDGVPPTIHKPGWISGIKGLWNVSDAPGGGATLAHVRPAPRSKDANTSSPVASANEQVGTFGLHVPAAPGVTSQLLAADSLSTLFGQFASGRHEVVPERAVHGGAVATVTVPAGGFATATVVFGWSFSERYMTGESIGNRYATLYPLGSTAAEDLGRGLLETVQQIHAVHTAFFNASSVPVWLQDTLVNSMSQWRSGFMTRDGRWRQWEAYDCVDLDSVHNDYQRHMPYSIFFPDLLQNVIESGWAKLQQPNGMISESLSWGCMGPTGHIDSGGGRVMGDVSSVFVIEALEVYTLTGDRAWLDRVTPAVLRAVDWLVDVGTAGTALPHKQCCTYDLLDFQEYDHSTYNSFLYLAAMRACSELGGRLANTTLKAKCDAAYAAGTVAVNASLWNATDGYFRAWSDSTHGSPPWVMADALYGQVIANYLQLDTMQGGSAWLVPPGMIASHLKTEASYNPSPYGLIAVSTSGRPATTASQSDHTVVDAARTKRGKGVCSNAVAKSKFNTVWMLAAPDWAALQLSLGPQGVGVDAAMAMAQKELDQYRVTLRDQWNIHGITAGDGYGVDGQPWCSAHYGMHMSIWYLPLALSGQRYSNGTDQYQPSGDVRLTFDPKVPCPYTLPVLVPGGVGLLSCQPISGGFEQYTIVLTTGKLELNILGVGKARVFATTLFTGKPVVWNNSSPPSPPPLRPRVARDRRAAAPAQALRPPL